MRKLALLLCLLLLLLTAACGSTATAPAPTEAPAPSAAPAPTTAPTPEPTLAPEPAPAPTSTPAPTPAPTPTPTPTPSGSSHKGDATAEDAPTGPAWLTLPEGARWLTHKELAVWGAWFSADFIRDQFLYSTYARPEDVDLFQLFYNGPGREVPPADLTDIRAFLMVYGSWNTWTDVMKLPAETADDVLKDYTGLEVGETAGVGKYMLSYVPETDCYYSFHGDTNRQGDPIFLYGWEKDETVSLFYEGFAFGHNRNLDGIFRVTLRLTPGDWRFVSNEFCQVEQGRLTCVAEPDDWYPEDWEESVGWLIPEADEKLSAESLTAAVDRVRGRFRNREEYALSFAYIGGSSEPFYGFIIGTCEDGSTEAYFLGGDGTVVPLPVPSHIPPEEVFYDANSTLLCQFNCGEETGDGYQGRSWTFLVPTGELFWRDYSW